jgi:hypothetical protein
MKNTPALGVSQDPAPNPLARSHAASHEHASDSVDCWVLNGFDPGAILPTHLQRYANITRYVVGRLAVWGASGARCPREQDGWVPLRAEDQTRLFGESGVWNEVRAALVDAEVIHCDESYEPGQKSKWYKLGERWRTHNVSRVTLRDKWLRKRLQRASGRQVAVPELTPAAAHLCKWLQQLRVDESVAKPWTAQQRSSDKQRTTAMQIQLIQSGTADIIMDSYGRVHSPVTNLRRVVRPALRIMGQRLAELDIASSQPLILGYVAGKVLSGDWGLDAVTRLGVEGPAPRSFAGLDLSPWSGQPPMDVREFVSMCETGRFYQTVADSWGMPCDTLEANRMVKRSVYKFVLFGPVRTGKQRWELFRRRWPNVASTLASIKQHDYGTCSRALQRLESALVIGGAVERLRSMHEGIPVQTIHDSALVIDDGDAIETVRSVMAAEFARIGLAPRIRSKAG